MSRGPHQHNATPPRRPPAGLSPAADPAAALIPPTPVQQNARTALILHKGKALRWAAVRRLSHCSGCPQSQLPATTITVLATWIATSAASIRRHPGRPVALRQQIRPYRACAFVAGMAIGSKIALRCRQKHPPAVLGPAAAAAPPPYPVVAADRSQRQGERYYQPQQANAIPERITQGRIMRPQREGIQAGRTSCRGAVLDLGDSDRPEKRSTRERVGRGRSDPTVRGSSRHVPAATRRPEKRDCPQQAAARNGPGQKVGNRRWTSPAPAVEASAGCGPRKIARREAKTPR